MSCHALMELTKSTAKLSTLNPTECCGVIVCGGHGCLQDLANSQDLGRWLYRLYHESAPEHSHRSSSSSATSSTSSPSGPAHHHNGRGVIAAVCHGTAALLSISKSGESLHEPDSDKETRWIHGKRLTCFSNEEERKLKTDKDSPFMLEDRFNRLGAKVEHGEPFGIHVVQDDRLITAQNTESVRALTRAFIHTIYREFGSNPEHKTYCPSC